MGSRRFWSRFEAMVLVILVLVLLRPYVAAGSERPLEVTYDPAWSQPTIDPYTTPEFAAQLRALRPTILAVAAEHNDPTLSGMTDREFAITLTAILYSEQVGWLDAAVPPLRPLMAPFQSGQTQANLSGNANMTIWPTNLRPSVALEILRGELPLPNGGTLTMPLHVEGSVVNPRMADQQRLYAAISRELNNPPVAIAYLAANLERGVTRAQIEGVPVTWETLASWHNQGIVAPAIVRQNPTAISYLGRTAAFLPLATHLIDTAETPRSRHLS